jgi:hypothetical protein
MQKSSMTGPEHFRAGEDKLSRASHLNLDDGESARLHMAMCAEAQAHFAAATTLTYGAMVADSDIDGVSEQWAALLGIESGE